LPQAGVGFAVEEGWIACDACHLLIEAGDQKGLALYSCDHLYRGCDLTSDAEKEAALIVVAEAQLGFWYQYDPKSGVRVVPS